MSDPHSQPPSALADPALVEVALSSDVSSADRGLALRLLGLAPQLRLQVAAVAAASTCDLAAEALALAAHGSPMGSAPVAVIGELAIMLFQPDEHHDSPAPDLCKALRQSYPQRFADGSLRVGVGSSVAPTALETSWEQAVLALRFAAPPVSGTPALAARTLVDHRKLGVFSLLAEIPRADLRNQSDVVALDALADTKLGALDIAALQAFCRTGSLRSAAHALYVHHSTVADRLARAAGALGWHLDDPADRFRAQLALCARRLADSPPAP